MYRAHDEKLIDLVRQYDALYNTSNAMYSDNSYKNRIWEEIGKELNTSGKSYFELLNATVRSSFSLLTP